MNDKKKKSVANPNPRNHMQAFHFIRSLSRINLSTVAFHKRYRAIKRAAYDSMARSANPSRAWRRAVLSRLRRCRRRSRPRTRRREAHHVDALRELLPGGEEMDSCRLLEETIDYVQSLRTQVTLMREVLGSVKEEGN